MGPYLKNLHNLKEILEPTLVGFIGVIIVNILFSFFPEFWANLFLGKTQLKLTLTFQDTMWLIFFVGCAQVFRKNQDINSLGQYQENKYLPEDFETIIDEENLTSIIQKSKEDASEKMGILPYMILQIALQYRTNKSISLTSDFLSKQLELFLHQVELRYSKLKYIIWLIPSLGFMGTVYGIGVAVSELGSGSLDDPELLTKMAGSLGIAFNTTLLALVLSVILQFLTQHLEAKEENCINRFGKYILENLVNKIVEDEV